jgi:hypothetical protein
MLKVAEAEELELLVRMPLALTLVELEVQGNLPLLQGQQSPELAVVVGPRMLQPELVDLGAEELERLLLKMGPLGPQTLEVEAVVRPRHQRPMLQVLAVQVL